jgi:hypothetical protein
VLPTVRPAVERRFRTTFKRFLSGSRFFLETSEDENLGGKIAAEPRYPNATDVIAERDGQYLSGVIMSIERTRAICQLCLFSLAPGVRGSVGLSYVCRPG